MSLFTTGIRRPRGGVSALSILLPMLFLGSRTLGNMPAIGPVARYLPDQVGMHPGTASASWCCGRSRRWSASGSSCGERNV
ncbi:hypothetical protein L0U85_17990 [Glycomyces sp. L485]|uniref:hypothetical protein n=1 Tax=Glycomyces sp. L485 TaxID=2909235 RepID=UPI001F4A7F76|nr:hypothetical protein [Glycomyces sp. L485]MCH7232728.1 hypothetical protein [Glycomyces sp. L485]